LRKNNKQRNTKIGEIDEERVEMAMKTVDRDDRSKESDDERSQE